MEKAVDEWWCSLKSTKPEPAIFWGFIEEARNRVIKLYEHGLTRDLVVPGPLLEGKQTTITIDQANMRGGRITSDAGRVESQLTSGPFAGQSEREVATKACRWWKDTLDKIDARARELTP